jgi:hypothetical protein
LVVRIAVNYLASQFVATAMYRLFVAGDILAERDVLDERGSLSEARSAAPPTRKRRITNYGFPDHD